VDNGLPPNLNPGNGQGQQFAVQHGVGEGRDWDMASAVLAQKDGTGSAIHVFSERKWTGETPVPPAAFPHCRTSMNAKRHVGLCAGEDCEIVRAPSTREGALPSTDATDARKRVPWRVHWGRGALPRAHVGENV
jgi:hypothetical protein